MSDYHPLNTPIKTTSLNNRFAYDFGYDPDTGKTSIGTHATAKGGSLGSGGGDSNIFGYLQSRQDLANGATAAGQRTAVQGVASQIDPSQQVAWRNRQMSLYNDLSSQANGVGPSLAQMQLQRGADQNISQAMALQASQRGMGMAGGMRNIAGQRSAIGQQLAGDSAQMRLQEQMQARQQMSALAGQSRAQDMTLADRQATLNQQMGLANMDSTNRQKAMNDGLVQFYVSQGLDLDKAQTQANIQLYGINSGQMLGLGQLNLQQGNADWGKIKDILSAAGTGMSQYATSTAGSAGQNNQAANTGLGTGTSTNWGYGADQSPYYGV